jgi:eukaryotic-like serine/threonine-protein kinase
VTKLASITGQDFAPRAPRAQIKVPLKLKLPSVDDAIAGEAMNLSASGMFLAMEKLPALGTQLDVEIEGADAGLLLHAVVEVVRHQTAPIPGIGVKFIDISYEAQALIDRMVADEKLFGDYRIEKLVGRGGMAEVYRAQVLAGEKAGRVVALKRILPELANNQIVVDLFRREAGITRDLRHPNIVEVLDIGTINNTLFIAMEYVDGADLRQILEVCAERGILLPLDFCCYVIQTVARALDFVHRATDKSGAPCGIVHRDVSPSNVFISVRGEIKLGDFGVAHIGSDRAGRRALAGKDPYLAPEQILGGEVRAATDVFALSAVFYEMLTNQLAFWAQDRAALRKRIASGDLTPPRAIRPDIPAELEEVVLTGLSTRIGNAPISWRARLREVTSGKKRERFNDAFSLVEAIDGLYDHGIGNELAIAAVVRNLFWR